MENSATEPTEVREIVKRRIKHSEQFLAYSDKHCFSFQVQHLRKSIDALILGNYVRFDKVMITLDRKKIDLEDDLAEEFQIIDMLITHFHNEFKKSAENSIME